MFKKIILITFLFFFSFSLWFADWKESLNKWNYNSFSEEYPEKQDIFKFQFVWLNDKWEFVIEYSKKQYDNLLRAYWWKEMLIFDPLNKNKYKFNTDTKFKWNSVVITILKDEKLDLAYNAKIEDECMYSFDSFTDFTLCNWSNNLTSDHIKDWKFLYFIKNGEFNKINDLLDESLISEWLWFKNWKIIFNGNIFDNRNYLFLKEKYKKNISEWKYNDLKLLEFDVDNKEKIIDYLKDIFYYEHLEFLLKNKIKWKDFKLLIADNDLILKGKNINSLNIIFWKNNEYIRLICREKKCTIIKLYTNEEDSEVDINFKKFKYKNFFNISKLILYLKNNWYLTTFTIENILNISYLDWTDDIVFDFLHPKKYLFKNYFFIKYDKFILKDFAMRFLLSPVYWVFSFFNFWYQFLTNYYN